MKETFVVLSVSVVLVVWFGFVNLGQKFVRMTRQH